MEMVRLLLLAWAVAVLMNMRLLAVVGYNKLYTSSVLQTPVYFTPDVDLPELLPGLDLARLRAETPDLEEAPKLRHAGPSRGKLG